MAQVIAELRGVTKAFGSRVILDNVDVKIHEGDALGVIGPSGTGKSTILRLISGLLAPDSGEVYVHGQKRERLLEEGEDPLGVGLVFQQSALFDSLSVGENVGFALYRRSRLQRAEIDELVKEKLELVGIPHAYDLYPSEISGGMKKRVSLARAIISDPSVSKDKQNILLYDEPTAGLDPVASTRIQTVIMELLKVKGACSGHLMVTHVHSTIQNTTDRIIFLYDGKIQWEGLTEDAYKSEIPVLKQFFSGSIDGPIQ
ncbi:MAG: putative ribonucleotide transport ATP-binding protein mkl [Chroococcopsis gigantea SAG 12.99]|jgi:phospholipid/cholesterol/gamma-HCH transport system ATP-binding protein|nr:putative ribonucleotide transport ATP-binding protein mkl [Chroococcopsis gigantea SAG 12.99]